MLPVTASESSNSPWPVDWHLLGAGSMGTLAAWRLQQAGARVHALHASLASITRTLAWPGGRQASLCLEVDHDGPVQALLLAVKTPDTVAALAQWRSRLHDDVLVLRLQNGMGSVTPADLPASARLYHLVTTDAAWRRGGHVQVVAENRTLAGDGSVLAPDWFHHLRPHWQGLQWHTDIERAQWQKLVVNAVINPLTALYRCRNGELLDGGERQQHMALLAAEADGCLARRYPDWPADTLVQCLRVARETAANTSSMLADVLAGRDTEIHFINGALLALAADVGMVLPHHHALLTRVLQAPKVATP